MIFNSRHTSGTPKRPAYLRKTSSWSSRFSTLANGPCRERKREQHKLMLLFFVAAFAAHLHQIPWHGVVHTCLQHLLIECFHHCWQPFSQNQFELIWKSWYSHQILVPRFHLIYGPLTSWKRWDSKVTLAKTVGSWIQWSKSVFPRGPSPMMSMIQ